MEGSSVRKQQTRVFSVTGIKPLELYCLRHTCLTRWAPKMDPFTLAYLAGHSDISITKRYVHPEDETIKAAMTSVWNSNAHRATFTECYIGHFYGIAVIHQLDEKVWLGICASSAPGINHQ